MSVFDLDFYKLTMLQFIWKHYDDVPVTFRLHSRKQDLEDIVNPRDLQQRLSNYLGSGKGGLNATEADYLHSLGVFEDAFIEDLSRLLADELPFPHINTTDTCSRGNVEVSGDWFEVSLWETVILSAVSEEYSKKNVDQPSDISRFAGIHAIERSGAKWADFGTRRRFSRYDHALLLKRLTDEKNRGNLDGFIGTSNVMMAQHLGLKPIGTYAHELEMVLRTVHPSEFYTTRDVLTKWQDMYPREMRIALTDTYTTKKFLYDHGKFLIDNDWRGVRLDSGNPIGIGWDVHEFLHRYDTPMNVVFSDGLDAETIVRIRREFAERSRYVRPTFGWGTGLTNPNSDLSLVMKAVEANGEPTYKTTDDAEKSIR